MRVVLAQPRGFCAGVVRAIDIVERALEKYGEPVYVRHEIVHNRHVVETLKRKGARFVEELDEVPDGAVTVFSAHGVAQVVVKDAAPARPAGARRDLPAGVQGAYPGQALFGKGRTLILIGHAGHPEVEGTMGQVGAPVHLVQSEKDVRIDVPPRRARRLCHADDARDRRHEQHHRGAEAPLHRHRRARTSATSAMRRRTANRRCANCAKVADVIIVVGAKNTSNSNRLREIGIEEGVPCYLIADGSELDPNGSTGKTTIGLTAGASAPGGAGGKRDRHAAPARDWKCRRWTARRNISSSGCPPN